MTSTTQKSSAPRLKLSPATGKMLADLSSKDRAQVVKIAAKLLAIKARQK